MSITTLREHICLFAIISISWQCVGCSEANNSSKHGDSTVVVPEGQQIADSDSPQPSVANSQESVGGDEERSSGAVEQRGDSDEQSNSSASFAWPIWRGPQGTGISSETGLLHSFPDSGPPILWRAKLGTGYSGIAVADGRAFTLYGAGGREYVACFDVNSGQELWKVDSDSDFAEGRSPGPRAMPCVDGDRVYTVGASGHMLCLDANSGNEIWTIDLTKDFGMRLHEEGLSPSPLIDGEKLIIVAGTRGASVLALNKMDGKVIWKSLGEPVNHATPSLVNIDGRRQLLVLTAQNLVGLSPEDGSELWRFPQQAVNIATPVAGPDNQVFIGASYGFGCQLVKVRGGKAEQVYKNNNMASHHATPVLYDGYLYGFHDRVGLFKCIDFASGEEQWVSREAGKGNIMIADGQIILLNEEGTLMLAPVSPQEFAPTASVQLLKGTCYTAPTLADGKLFLRSDQEMVCIDLGK